MADLFWFSDAQWARIEPLLPKNTRGLKRVDDRRLYRERNRIERSFGRLKDYRRIATRFDRNIKNFVGALCPAAVVVWWL